MLHVILSAAKDPHSSWGIFRLRLRMTKLWLTLVFLAVMSSFVCTPSYAYNFSNSSPFLLDWNTGNTCPGPNCGNVMFQIYNSTGHRIETCPGNPGLARRIIPCVQGTILAATDNFLIPFSQYFADTVAACCILAVMLWGANMIAGTETAPLKDATVMALKIGFVIIFTSNFGGMFGTVLDVMDDFLSLVTGYVLLASQQGLMDCKTYGDTNTYLVWDAVDCSIETLIGGIFSPGTVSAGIIGFLVACLFSNTVGFSIGMIGIYLIYKLLYAIFKCSYIFLSAYMGIAFMVVISPMFIPLILFKSTKSYFDKWLKFFIGFIIQPMVLFAYLAMLLAAFDVTVFSGNYSLYNSVAGRDPCFAVSVNSNCRGGSGFGGKIGTWMNTVVGYSKEDLLATNVALNSKALKKNGVVPKGSANKGVDGKMSQMFLDYAEQQRVGAMEMIDAAGGVGLSIPTYTVDWTHLAVANGYNGSDDAHSTTTYVLSVLISAFMALLTGYIFTDMLEMIPFISKGVSMGGGLADVKSLAGMDTNKLSGSGIGDFMKKFKFGS